MTHSNDLETVRTAGGCEREGALATHSLSPACFSTRSKLSETGDNPPSGVVALLGRKNGRTGLPVRPQRGCYELILPRSFSGRLAS